MHVQDFQGSVDLECIAYAASAFLVDQVVAQVKMCEYFRLVEIERYLGRGGVTDLVVREIEN